MAEFFDYDPHLGIRYDTEYDEVTDKITVHAQQDVQQYVDFATEVRNSGVADKGIKRDVWKYCTIPTIVQMQMRNKGIDIYNKDHYQAMIKEINTNYPKLKYTTLHHE